MTLLSRASKGMAIALVLLLASLSTNIGFVKSSEDESKEFKKEAEKNSVLRILFFKSMCHLPRWS
ncbi:hypothetical protein MCERE19_00173 [Spirosomataceae bacterium]